VQVCEALADDIRVRIVELLAERDLSAGEIAAHFSVTRPAVSRHLRVLRETGLTTVSRDAQRRVYRLDPAPLRDLEHWLSSHREVWQARLDALGSHLDDMERDERRTRRRPKRSTR